MLLALEQVQKIFERWSGMDFPAPILVDKFDVLNLLLASGLVRNFRKSPLTRPGLRGNCSI